MAWGGLQYVIVVFPGHTPDFMVRDPYADPESFFRGDQLLLRF